MKLAIARHAVTALVAAAVLAGLAGPSHAQFVLYDDFSSGFISPELWSGLSTEGTFDAPTAETIRIVENGALHLALVSWGDNTSDSGSVTSRQRLQMRQVGTPGGSGFITGMKAKVTVLDTTVQDCVTNPATGNSVRARALLLGWFFNDGTSTGPTDATGNIFGGIQLIKGPVEGTNQIQSFVFRCTNASCGTFAEVGGNNFATTWSPNTPLIVKMVWKQANGKFTFAVTDPVTLATESAETVYQGIVAEAGPPANGDFHVVGLQNSVKNCSTGRKQVTMDALFDAVKVKRAP